MNRLSRTLAGLCTILCTEMYCFAEKDMDSPLVEQYTPSTVNLRAMNSQRVDQDASFFISAVLKTELHAQENAAIQAYFHESREVAAWALEALLSSYSRNSLIMRDIDTEWEHETKSHRMFAHARLYKLYTRMNNEQQAQQHLNEAVHLSDGKSVETIMMIVAHVDRVQANKAANQPTQLNGNNK